jgi:hypothetical protein
MHKLTRRIAFFFLSVFIFILAITFGSPLLTNSLAINDSRNIVVFVADGLRYGMIDSSNTPNLYYIRQNGVNFINSHSLFPTFTTPNASAIATGHYLGDTGDFGNSMYSEQPISNSVTPSIENDSILSGLNQYTNGNFLNEESLLAASRLAGFNTAAVGKLGPVLIQDVSQSNPLNKLETVIVDDSTGTSKGVPLRDDIVQLLENNQYFKQTYVDSGYTTSAIISPSRSNGCSNKESCNNGILGTNSANLIQQNYFTDVFTKAILPLFNNDSKPFVAIYWSRDPDGTQHFQGDSLNSFTPGINGPTSLAAIKNADENLGKILHYLKVTPDHRHPGKTLNETTDIFVTADHGFSTISKGQIDPNGTLTKSYSATLNFEGVSQGYLPKGFLSIDLAKFLSLNIYDPDSGTVSKVDSTINYPLVDFHLGHLSKNGNALIGGTGMIKNGKIDAQIIITANGGSDLVYIPSGDSNVAKQVIKFLTEQDYIDGIFADDRFGNIPGTLPLSAINLLGTSVTKVPAIVVNFKSFVNPDCPKNFPTTNCMVEIADTALQQGQGMHGSFNRGDTYNNMSAIGPDFKSSFVSLMPISNADVAVTLAEILKLKIPHHGLLMGRVLEESFKNGSYPTKNSKILLKSSIAQNGYQTTLSYQKLDSRFYFDWAKGSIIREIGAL